MSFLLHLCFTAVTSEHLWIANMEQFWDSSSQSVLFMFIVHFLSKLWDL